jgi:hypothetical protein
MAFQQFPQKGGIPSGNTAGRPSNPVIGDTYYNGQNEVLEIYNGTAWVANSAPPATPSVTSVTDVGTDLPYATGGTLTVVVAPGTGGSTALQYNAATLAGGFNASSSSTTISLTGLTSNTSFEVVASASNNFGTTVNSAPFTPVLVTTNPQAAVIGTATTSGISIVVSWTNGNNGGKNLTALQVVPYLNGTTAQTAQNAASTSAVSLTMTGLTQGSNYTFRVKSTNANGFVESLPTNSVTIPGSADFMVIAGGGAGGGAYGGGGGAGGFRVLEAAIVSGITYTVTVGNGGAGGTGSYASGSRGGKGGTSSVSGSGFTTISATGGGGGGTWNTQVTGATGGSGGGGAIQSAGAAGN